MGLLIKLRVCSRIITKSWKKRDISINDSAPACWRLGVVLGHTASVRNPRDDKMVPTAVRSIGSVLHKVLYGKTKVILIYTKKNRHKKGRFFLHIK